MKRVLVFVLTISVMFTSCSKVLTSEKNTGFLKVAEKVREEYSYGSGVRIAVIDSGVAENCEVVKESLNFSKENVETDLLDHGTPIVNIIASKKYGFATEADVYSLKVINQYGNASTQAIFNALQWCKENSIDIINMSCSFGLHNENIECIIQELIDEGVIIVASISNDEKEFDYPAMYPGVICVGKTKNLSLYDKHRSVIFATDYTVGTIGISGEYKDYVGNSFLAPVVTGMIACMTKKTTTKGINDDGWIITQIKQLLQQENFKLI